MLPSTDTTCPSFTDSGSDLVSVVASRPLMVPVHPPEISSDTAALAVTSTTPPARSRSALSVRTVFGRGASRRARRTGSGEIRRTSGLQRSRRLAVIATATRYGRVSNASSA